LNEYARSTASAYQFQQLVAQALPNLLDSNEITQEPVLPDGLHPDFIVMLSDGTHAIVETKLITPTTQHRIRNAIRQLLDYADRYEQINGLTPRLFLAVPEVLSDRYRDLLASEHIDLIDGPAIRRAAAESDYPPFLARDEDAQPESLTTAAQNLLDGLDKILPGKKQWSHYQNHMRDTLAFLLCPPLNLPITESANISGINRRDIILPNYAPGEFWAYMRSCYEAHYIVVDAKNYSNKVSKNAVLQLANYLSPHGAGLFGVIATRTGDDRGAEITRREQWLLHRKMIVILNDEDVRQMIKFRATDIDPAEVIRQRIEDFRLGF